MPSKTKVIKISNRTLLLAIIKIQERLKITLKLSIFLRNQGITASCKLLSLQLKNGHHLDTTSHQYKQYKHEEGKLKRKIDYCIRSIDEKMEETKVLDKIILMLKKLL